MTKYAIRPLTLVDCSPEEMQELAKLLANYHGTSVEVTNLETGQIDGYVECDPVEGKG